VNSVAPPPRVLADPDAKASLYRERFHLLAQRLARNPMFGKPALKGVVTGSGGPVLELTPLQALLGTTGERRFVLGALSQLEDGRYWLEDATGSCAVDVSGAATSAGLFTENCVVVAEGSLRRDGVFEARALGFPPVEPRWESLKALGPHLDLFGAGTIRCVACNACKLWHSPRTLTLARLMQARGPAPAAAG
jgi:DNA polymerase epsilon subunit 2